MIRPMPRPFEVRVSGPVTRECKVFDYKEGDAVERVLRPRNSVRVGRYADYDKLRVEEERERLWWLWWLVCFAVFGALYVIAKMAY